MIQFTLTYKREDWGSNFIVPSDRTQLSQGIFEKSFSYGYTLKLPFDLFGGSSTTISIIGKDQSERRIKPNKQGFYIIYLGIRICRPKGSALYHIGLLKNSMNFVIDKFYKEWYKVNIYYHIDNRPYSTELKGKPVMQIIPIPDREYQFYYEEIKQ